MQSCGMEGNVRSGILKKRTSAGCLIIRKKVGNENLGRGLGVDSNEKRRGGFVESCSGSSDDEEPLEFTRGNVNDMRVHNGSMGYTRHEFEGRGYDRDNVGIEISSERKRNRVGSFGFDEYDGKKTRNEYYDNGFNMFAQNGNENVKEFGVSSLKRNLVVDKRRQSSYFDGSSSGRSKGFEYNGVRNKSLEVEEDETHMPMSMSRLKNQASGNQTIRLQGKNGVLKVMVNKKRTMNFPSQPKRYDSRDFKETKHSRWDDGIKHDLSVQSPIYPITELPETRGLFGDKEKSVEKEKRERNLEKVTPLLNQGNKARHSEVEGIHSVPKLTPSDAQACITEKGMEKEEERSPGPENLGSVKAKEGKAKRGGSTEKQMLREKIRGMLLDAGWSIDHRPRRNRDYLDAVYVSPSGTAYWSIIKAYEALKKQLGEDNAKSEADATSSLFAPLSEDLINKLTRQTKKKTEEEMKRKRKEDEITKSVKMPTLREAADSSDSDQNEEQFSYHTKQNYKSSSGKMSKVDHDSDNDSPKRMSGKARGEKPSTSPKSKVIHGRTSDVVGRCTVLVRGSDKGENLNSDGYAPYSGKRTVLAWLIDSGAAQLSEKVRYMNRRRNQIMLEGWITRDGIHCGCCSKILTVSKFELHAGSKLRQPFQNIFLESGSSLLQCQMDAWNKQDQSICRDFHTVHVDGDDPDDDTCGICADGGDLICCDSCPSTFHRICLGIQMLPKGDWHCPNCICKFCGHAEVNYVAENDSIDDELRICYFCGRKYHKLCSTSVNSSDAPFCELKCQEFYDHLQKILGVKHELEAGFSWSLIQRSDVSDASQRGFAQRVECNSKLAVALSVMDECFHPIIDRRSGINIVQSVVYNCGSNFNRLNFHAFYSIIMERGDEMISAASIRFNGNRVAEMPFIGTLETYRRQGMCRRLFSVIESELCSLGIERLIIPAISEHTHTWTTVFGFRELESVHKNEMKSMNVLVFPGVYMLQKHLAKCENSGINVSESSKNRPQLPVLVKKSRKDSSIERNRLVVPTSRIKRNELHDEYYSDTGNRMLDPPAIDMCASEDAARKRILNNGSIESHPCSSSEPSSDSDVTNDDEADVPGCSADLSPIREVDNDNGSPKRISSVVGTSHDKHLAAHNSTSSDVETTPLCNAGVGRKTIVNVKRNALGPAAVREGVDPNGETSSSEDSA